MKHFQVAHAKSGSSEIDQHPLRCGRFASLSSLASSRFITGPMARLHARSVSPVKNYDRGVAISIVPMSARGAVKDRLALATLAYPVNIAAGGALILPVMVEPLVERQVPHKTTHTRVLQHPHRLFWRRPECERETSETHLEIVSPRRASHNG